jgi:hypothetical protein
MSVKVNVGDLIHYRYGVRGGFTNYDSRVVLMIDNEGFWVQGGYHIPTRDVMSVSPAESEPPAGRGPREGSPSGVQGAGEHRAFPLEAGQ